MGRLTLLVTSPRVPPGLLSRAGWAALESAGHRFARPGEPLADAVADEGLGVEPLDHRLAPPALARHLVAAAADGDVVWLGSSDGDPGLTDAVASEVSRLADPPPVEVVVGSWDVPGARLLDVVAAMDRLRSPGGCPWDAEQTHESLAPYLLEETHEVLEAIAGGDRPHLRDELGDILLQVAFHARVAEDADDPADRFDIDDVAAHLVAKLVRRHPHVFADGDAETPEEVERAWERIKADERAEAGQAGGDAFDLRHGIPSSAPALLAAQKVLTRAARHGLPAPVADGTAGGDLLAEVERLRRLGADAETALLAATGSYAVHAAEGLSSPS